MILVDSSVWIDFFRGAATPQVEKLDALLGNTPLLIGDLIFTEVLQGLRTQREFNQVRKMLEHFDQVDIGGHAVALQAAPQASASVQLDPV